MASPFGKAVVIANPHAGKGRVGRDPKELEAAIAAAGVDFDLRLTQRRGHAAEIAREAMDSGCRYLIAAGGDGTIHEVVNGMMGESGPLDREAVLGVVSSGSGGDFIRTFGLPSNREGAVRHLAGDNVFQIDVGKVTFAHDGETRTEYFPNIAEAGFGAEVVRRAERLPRWVGRLRYLITFLFTLGAFKIRDVKVILDDRVYEGPMTNLVIANCQFFGGGMRVAPKALPDDGRFDVLLMRGTKIDYLSSSSKVFKGEHLPSPQIKEYYAARVEVQSERPLRVEADGELLGFTPAIFEIVPKALRLKI